MKNEGVQAAESNPLYLWRRFASGVFKCCDFLFAHPVGVSNDIVAGGECGGQGARQPEDLGGVSAFTTHQTPTYSS